GAGGGTVPRPGADRDAGRLLLRRPGVEHLVALLRAQRRRLREHSARVPRMVRPGGGALRGTDLIRAALRGGAMQLEDYFDFQAPDDIRIKGHRIGIETVLYDYIHRHKTPEEIA